MKDLSFRRLLPGFATGAIIAIIDVTLNISLAALIFSGPLSGYLGLGIGFLSFGTAMLALLTATFSSYPGMIAVVQDAPIVILALAIASISGSLAAAQPETRYVTAVATIALSTLLTAGFFLILGVLKLGNLVRFIPYPVMGGFLAGAGWLLLSGGLGVMAGASLGSATLLQYFSGPLLVRWLPGLIFGVALFWVLKRTDHSLAIPGMVLGATLLFYLVLFLMGVSIPQGIELGLLFEPFPEGPLWNLPPFASLPMVAWGAILAHGSNLAVMALIAVLAMLLNASSMEVVAEQEIDLNRELRVSGAANLLAGLGGSPVGYSAVSFSALNQKMAGGSRITGIIVAGIVFIILIFGAPVLALFPKPLVGGMLVFIGLSFLAEWLVDGWFKLSRSDYLIVLTILVTMGTLGPLPGVGLGLILAAGIFIVKYSQVRVIQRVLTGESYRSTVDRPKAHRAFLRENGNQIHILKLQGFLFFGTAHLLLDDLRERVSGEVLSPPGSAQPAFPQFILLDFSRVDGCDSSGLFSFERMHQLARDRHIALLFTHLSPDLKAQFEKSRLPPLVQAGTLDDRALPPYNLLYFSSLDQGVEWCENRMLEDAPIPPQPIFDSPPEQLTQCLDPAQAGSPLLKYMDRNAADPGVYLMRQGESAGSMVFLLSGSAAVMLEMEPGPAIRLRTLRPGSIVGEIGYYVPGPRTASVITQEPSEFLTLSYANFDRLQLEEPHLAADMHRWLASLLAERLADDVRIITALAED